MTFPSQIDKYRLIKRLGGGSFGEVYLAHDLALASNTAIKLVKIKKLSDAPALIREAQILYQCRHKHIVEIREANVFPAGGEHYLVFGLEYLPEGSIESEMRNRWISVKESCTRVGHVLSGLEYAHSKEYLHRDIKPGNILIAGNSSKLSDFGLASLKTLCTTGMMSYTRHCPPEHHAGQVPTTLFDIYAAGITLFRIVNNYSAWRDRLKNLANLDEVCRKGLILKQIGYQRFVPEKVKRIINRACNVDPVKRYQDATSFKNDLDRLRFNIDWVRISVGNWQGMDGRNSYEIRITTARKRFVTISIKNGRRVKANCRTFPSFNTANEYIETISSESAFQ